MSKLPLPTIPPSLRGTLNQPASIAMAASVGIHGLLFVLLPMLPSSSFEPSDDDQRTVDLVELTPDELSRLPDLSPPEAPLVPQLPDIQANNPTQGDLFEIPDSFNPVPQVPVQPNQPFFIPPYPPPIAIQPSTPVIVEPQAPATPATPVTPEPSPTEPLPQPQTAPDFGETRDLPELQAIDPTVPLEGEPIARRPEEETTPAEPSETLMAEQAELRELFAYSKEGTTNEEADFAFGTWYYDELGREQTISDDERLTINASYTVTACRILGRIQDEPKSLTAIYGVVIAPDGTVKDEPRLIRSSGFKYFNQQAQEAIATYDFSGLAPAEGDGIYLVDVVFEYSEDICPTPALPVEEEAPTG